MAKKEYEKIGEVYREKPRKPNKIGETIGGIFVLIIILVLIAKCSGNS